MSEAVLNALAQRLVEMTLSKTRYDLWDLQWYTEGHSGEERVCAIHGNIKLFLIMKLRMRNME